MARPYKKITYKDRVEIESLYNSGEKVQKIAATIGTHKHTIYRELHRGKGADGIYHADVAQKSL